mmetsp:Transcript_4279/g.11079  ORF Transcript_4279/g.11079 Transcript_4279/m.11079 type:complete len:255 (-) Transcript_4279:109-873(-)
MADDQKRLADPLHLLGQRFQPEGDVHVGLPPGIPVRELVGLPPGELVREHVLNLLVGHPVAGPRVQLVEVPARLLPELHPLEDLPVIERVVELRVLDELGRLLGPPQRARPQPARALLGRLLRLLVAVFELVVVRFAGQDRLVDLPVVGLILRSGPGDLLLGEDGEPTGVLAAGRGQTGIASDLAQQVVLGLTVPGQVEGPWQGVEVHDEVHDLEGQVSPDVVDDVPVGVDDLAEGTVVLVDRLIVLFVLGAAG